MVSANLGFRVATISQHYWEATSSRNKYDFLRMANKYLKRTFCTSNFSLDCFENVNLTSACWSIPKTFIEVCGSLFFLSPQNTFYPNAKIQIEHRAEKCLTLLAWTDASLQIRLSIFSAKSMIKSLVLSLRTFYFALITHFHDIQYDD